MKTASNGADGRASDRRERWRSWLAAALTALLHLLLLLLVLLSPPITMSTPQDSAGGSRAQVTEVTFIDAAPPSPAPPVTPPATKAKRKPAKASPVVSRVRSTLVAQADARVPHEEPQDTPAERPNETEPAQAPTESPPPPSPRRSKTWGMPPGMLAEETAPTNAGLTMGPAVDRGRSSDGPSAQPSMEVDGYQVYYDLLDDAKLRAWRDEGITEVFLPLPGTRRYMVCPLELALRRESGACRMIEPNAPELKTIGDARRVINMQRVYKLGEVVWRGPGPYR